MHSQSNVSVTLLFKAYQGDKFAQGQVLLGLKPQWLRYLRGLGFAPEDAEDVFSELFPIVSQTINNLSNPYAFQAYYKQRLHWIACEHLRKKRVQVLSLEALASLDDDTSMDAEKMACLVDTSSFTPLETVLQKEKSSCIERALDCLPPIYAKVIRLVYLQEQSYEEVAERLHIPIGTVRSRASNGRTRLRKILEKMLF